MAKQIKKINLQEKGLLQELLSPEFFEHYQSKKSIDSILKSKSIFFNIKSIIIYNRFNIKNNLICKILICISTLININIANSQVNDNSIIVNPISSQVETPSYVLETLTLENGIQVGVERTGWTSRFFSVNSKTDEKKFSEESYISISSCHVSAQGVIARMEKEGWIYCFAYYDPEKNKVTQSKETFKELNHLTVLSNGEVIAIARDLGKIKNLVRYDPKKENPITYEREDIKFIDSYCLKNSKTVVYQISKNKKNEYIICDPKKNKIYSCNDLNNLLFSEKIKELINNHRDTNKNSSLNESVTVDLKSKFEGIQLIPTGLVAIKQCDKYHSTFSTYSFENKKIQTCKEEFCELEKFMVTQDGDAVARINISFQNQYFVVYDHFVVYDPKTNEIKHKSESCQDIELVGISPDGHLIATSKDQFTKKINFITYNPKTNEISHNEEKFDNISLFRNHYGCISIINNTVFASAEKETNKHLINFNLLSQKIHFYQIPDTIKLNKCYIIGITPQETVVCKVEDEKGEFLLSCNLLKCGKSEYFKGINCFDITSEGKVVRKNTTLEGKNSLMIYDTLKNETKTCFIEEGIIDDFIVTPQDLIIVKVRTKQGYYLGFYDFNQNSINLCKEYQFQSINHLKSSDQSVIAAVVERQIKDKLNTYVISYNPYAKQNEQLKISDPILFNKNSIPKFTDSGNFKCIVDTKKYIYFYFNTITGEQCSKNK